jgi:hypothetical protein
MPGIEVMPGGQIMYLGEPIEKAMLWAPINSMNVVQKLGAQAGLLTKAKIEKYLQEAPKDFKTEEIEE